METERGISLENNNLERRNRIAQWVFDTLPVLNRFHLWLKDVKTEELKGYQIEDQSFLGSQMARSLVMSAAATALGTRLFGRYGEGKGKEKDYINQVKKDADAISAYTISESLWHLSRNLPENHAILVCIGEGLLAKAGETPDMGANPLLGFGRIYARPQVARYLEKRVHRLINDPEYEWDHFYTDIQEEGITIWGVAVDTLENTNRFALGAETGPITVLHIFDQPLVMSSPYEGYISTLLLPRAVVEGAENDSILINANTPRRIILEAVQRSYPGIKSENVFIWTLRGSSRVKRIGELWQEWQDLGVTLVDDGSLLPNGKEIFTGSGTYAPTCMVGSWQNKTGETCVFIVDGYAASAEAVQASSLASMLGVSCSMVMLSSSFKLPYHREKELMKLDPDSPDFETELGKLLPTEIKLTPDTVSNFKSQIRDTAESGFPIRAKAFDINMLFPKKQWDGAALIGYMLDDPYTGEPGVQKLADNLYRVAVRMITPNGLNRYEITLELKDDWEESRKIFNPLLDRFVAGENYQERPVKKSDSGRIRNELQTLCSQALEHENDGKIRVRLSKIDDLTMPAQKKENIRQILLWFKAHHPIWFKWLELGD
ncbi:hypothetical protein JXQ70_12470 [bacterium]|nr:hypothetical protein [bacterium]